MSDSRRTRDVSGVFARNLQTLMADRPSISAVCRALDINRTQFNRYLSAEAHPRPEVLAKICAHFGRDARILLEPLDEIDAVSRAQLPEEIDPSALTAQIRDFDHARMPDGFYRVLTPANDDPEAVFSTLVNLFTLKDGGKGVRWAMPLFAALPTGKPTGWRDRRQTGLCLQHSSGVSMLMASQYTRLFLLYFVSPGYRGLPNVHAGFSALTLPRQPGFAPVGPLLIEQLAPGLAPALACRRAGMLIPRDRLTNLQRGYFETWSADWSAR